MHRAPPAIFVTIVSLAVDTHDRLHGIPVVVKDKPRLGREVDLMRYFMTVHATTNTLATTDKATNDIIDMDPKEPLVPAPTFSDIDCLADKVFIHTSRIAVSERAPVIDTSLLRLVCRT